MIRYLLLVIVFVSFLSANIPIPFNKQANILGVISNTYDSIDSPLWKGGTKFPSGWDKETIISALGKTITHGKKSKWYNLSIFEKRMNIMGSGYRNFKATINIDGSVRTFHMMEK